MKELIFKNIEQTNSPYISISMRANFLDWLTENKEAYAKGPGLFCTAHILLMLAMVILCIALIIIAYRFPKFAKKFGAVLVVVMLVLRIARMITMVASGKYTFVEILPWHLCHITCFLLAIVYFIKPTKYISLPVLCMAVLGGTMTFIFGDYYYINSVSFYMIESIFLHFCLNAIVICYVASRKPKYNWIDILLVFVWLGVMCGWSSLGNFCDPGHNYMYIQKSGLPFTFFPSAHFLLDYLIIGLILISLSLVVYLMMFLIKKHKKKT